MFMNYRKVVKQEGAVTSASVNIDEGRDISVIKSKVRDSDLMRYARELSTARVINLVRNKAPYIFETYKSFKSNLNNDSTRKMTGWAKYVNWDNFRTDLRTFYSKHLTVKLNDAYDDYYLNVTPYSLSPLTSKLIIDSLLEYGYNAGKWDTENVKLWNAEADDMLSHMKWTDIKLTDFKRDVGEIESQKEAWNELVISNPMFGILRHDATSGWPDYHAQTTDYICKTVDSAVDAEPDYITSMYHRRHGYKRVVDKRGVAKLVMKIRFVGGSEFVIKIDGLPITWSFKMSRPPWTAYYRPWASEIFTPMSEFLEGFDGFVFTADQKLCDAHHDDGLMSRIQDRILNNEKAPLPDHMKEYVKREYEGFKEPIIQISPEDAIKIPRTIAISGYPSIPLRETVSTGAGQRTCIKKQSVEIEKEELQIDDTFYATNKKVDLDKFAIDCGSIFGMEISSTKTETMEKGFVVFLQVCIGDLYIDPKDLTFLVPIRTDKTNYIGFGPRRDHRLKDRERMKRSGLNDIQFERGDFPADTTQRNVERLLGTLSSYGPQMPVELLDIHTKHLSGFKTNKTKMNPIWSRLVDFVKSEPKWVQGDFGFDPRFILKYYTEIY